jgi:DNA-binding Xre family transcriptional regulator
MIRWRVPELLKKRGWTPGQLAAESGLSRPAAYRLAKGGPVPRIDATTLDRLCELFDVEPGELIERVPNGGRRARR